MRRELGLTDEQMKRLRDMGTQAQRSGIRTRADLEIKQLDLQELLGAANPDRAAIDRTIREIAELRAAEMKAGIDMRLGLQSVLTPEQREKMRGLRERRFRERGVGPGAPRPPESPTPGRPRRQTTPTPAPTRPQL